MEAQTTPNEFTIRFDGELHQVNADTLISSLVNISTILQEINYEYNKDVKVDVKIKALTEGSFCVNWLYDFIGLVATSTHLLPPIIDAGDGLLKMLVGVLDLKKFLKGEKPQSVREVGGDNLEVKNNKGNVSIVMKPVYNVYFNNQKVQDAISNNFSTLQEDPTVEGFQVLDRAETVLYSVAKSEFESMARKSSEIEEGVRKIIEVANLHIFKLVFDPKYIWEFYYKGNKISAYITDKEFFENVDSGEEFAKGDTLIVELEIKQIFDPAVNTFVNNEYKVLKVNQHIPRSKQPTLNL